MTAWSFEILPGRTFGFDVWAVPAGDGEERFVANVLPTEEEAQAWADEALMWKLEDRHAR